jgi:tRNA threonylcarbamoyl adenosine modification protein YeaZ
VRTLVIDTVTKACSVALYDGESVIASTHEIIGRGHAERLLPVIAALPERGKADRIYVDVGPGSFTGIRVGVAAAVALGFAWSVPVHGYNCLALVAAMARERHGEPLPVDAVMTGGHGEYFHQYFDATGASSAAPVSIAPGQLAARLTAFTVAGDIADVPPDIGHFDLLPDASCWHLLGAVDPLPPKPVYARGPDAKPPEAVRS